MKHGPIALIDDLMPVVFIAPKDGVYQKVVSNVEEVRARGGRVFAVVTEGDTGVARPADHKVEVPETRDLLTPVLTVLPLQLLAYYIAVRRGCNAAPPEAAVPLYERFVALLRERGAGSGIRVETGEFGAMMEVELVNDGPVTLILEK